MYPSTAQRRLVKIIVGVYRTAYNYAVDVIKADPSRCNGKHADQRWRAACINDDSDLCRANPSVRALYAQARQAAVEEAMRAGQRCKDVAKLKYKSRSDKSISVPLLAQHYARVPNAPTKGAFCLLPNVAPETLRSKRPLPEHLEYHSRLQLTRSGRLYLCEPTLLPAKYSDRKKVSMSTPIIPTSASM